jgi:hypothetical protein
LGARIILFFDNFLIAEVDTKTFTTKSLLLFYKNFYRVIKTVDK